MDKNGMDVWRQRVLTDLKQRNKREAGGFVELIASHANLQSKLDGCKAAIHRLEYEKSNIQKLFEEAVKDDDNHSPGKKDKKYAEQRGLQKELMEAYRKRGELADKVYEITAMMNEKDGELNKKDKAIHELQATISALRAESESYQQKYELEAAVSKSVQDEHRNLQMLYVKERDKNGDLRRIIEKQNQELKEMKESKDKIKGLSMSRPPLQPDATVARQLSTTSLESSTMDSLTLDKQYSLGTTGSAATSTGPQDPTYSLKKSISPMSKKRTNFAICPSSNVHQFDAHESDVSALCFSPDGTYLATGGSDKVVKVWTIKPDMRSVDSSCTILSGSKASIVSLQFDPTAKMVLAASNDNMARIWTVSDQMCKHTLTGHSAKVLAAKFLADDIQKVVTGSHDRTLKIWDLAQNTCFRTIFATSSCNDVIAMKGKSGSGCTLISGHLDKRIRFWDIRSTSTASEIALPGKITSLDHNPDRQLLLCCSQDDSLRLIDLRQNAISTTFSANGFKVGVDWSRACFSPDGQYVAAGSADGSVFVWEVVTGKMKSKKEHMGSSVVVCGWHPSGQLFASGDRNKKVTLWTS